MIPPVIFDGRPSGRLRLATYAGGVYWQVFAAATEGSVFGTNFWPSSNPDPATASYQPTSTGYFRWLLTPYDEEAPEKGAEVLAQDFFVFNAPDLEGVGTLEELTPETNPWCVVADVNEKTSSGTPFMISRNLNATELKSWDQPEEALENVGKGTYRHPFEDEIVIVVRMGGGTEVLNRKQLFWDLLNPTKETFPILQP